MSDPQPSSSSSSSSSLNGPRVSSRAPPPPPPSSSFLPTKSSSSNAATRSSSSLSSKFSRFVGNVLSSPSSSSAAASQSTAAPSASTSEGAAAGGSSSRRHSGWVDLVPNQDGSPPTRDQDKNPFLVSTGEASTSTTRAGPSRSGSRAAGEASISAPQVVVGSSSRSLVVSSSSVPPTPIRQHSYTSQGTSSPPPRSRRQSSSSNSANGTTDQQVFVSSSSPSLRSTWTRKTRPRANTGGSTNSTSTPKWSWTAISSGSLAKGFASNPTGTGTGTGSFKAKGGGGARGPIDSGWGEPDDLVPERAVGSFEDEGYWEGESGNQGFDIISSLPTEIALYIYLFLPRPSLAVCARVSRTWNELAADSSIWRAYFVSNPSWHLRPSYLRSRLPPPSPSTQLASLSLHSPTLTPTPTRRPAPSNRTPSSISKVASLAPDSFVPEGIRLGASGIPWKKVCEKRVWLDRRWGDEKVGGEMKLEGHDDSVYCLQFDRKKIVTGSRDQNIKVWSLDTGECLQTVHAHDASVLCLMFEPETGFMVSGGSDAKIIVWDLGGPGIQQKPLTKKHILGGHKQGVLDIAINKDYIVSCSKDTNLLIHSRSNLDHLHTLTGHTGPVNAIGICGGRVASASGDGKVKIWDIVSGECVRTMEGHERGLACVDFKEDYVVSGSNDRTMKVWSASTGECLRTLTGHTDLVRTLAMDPESGRIVSGGYDKQILIWSLFTGEIVQTLKSSHTSLVFDIKFDAGKIVSASHDKLVIVHDFGDDESARMFA